MTKDDEKKEKETETEKIDDGLITAVYKMNLHCPQCAIDIRVPLMKTQGVLKVDANFETDQVTVVGMIDPKKIQQRLEKMSKKNVELISPLVKTIVNADVASETKTETKIVKAEAEIKETVLWKTTFKVHMHCEKCEHDLKEKLLRHKGVCDVKTDMKAQTIIIYGTVEPEKLVAYLQKKVHKHAEIVPPKPEKKEKAEILKVETKITEAIQKVLEPPKEEKKAAEVKEKEAEEKKVADVKEKCDKEKNVVEIKEVENNVPYFIHYVYAPQTFSDENPNACCVM